MDRGCSRAIASTRLTLTSGSACESEAGWRSSDGARARVDPEARAASWSVWTTKVRGALSNASDWQNSGFELCVGNVAVSNLGHVRSP